MNIKLQDGQLGHILTASCIYNISRKKLQYIMDLNLQCICDKSFTAELLECFNLINGSISKKKVGKKN